MTEGLVKQSIAELQDIVRCRCCDAYKVRGLHDPSCECDSADAVQVVADRIEELEAKLVTKKTCPLGKDCDLTIAWMAGRESAKDECKAKIAGLEAKLAKAVEALDEAWFMLTVPHLNYEPEPEEPGLRRIKTALAELKGEK